jgi:hypothetical protein
MRGGLYQRSRYCMNVSRVASRTVYLRPMMSQPSGWSPYRRLSYTPPM